MKTLAVVTLRLTLGLLAAVMGGQWIATPARAETVTIGGSMDRGLAVHPGDTIRAGFQVLLDDDKHGKGAATLVVTNGVVTVTIECSRKRDDDDDRKNHDRDDDKDKGPDRTTLTIHLSSRTYNIPANGNFSSPSNDYQGQITAPSNLCGGRGGKVDGATFSANSAFTCHANASEGCCHKVCFRFHVLYNNHGGTFSRTECENERQCASPTKHGEGHCCDKDRDRD